VLEPERKREDIMGGGEGNLMDADVREEIVEKKEEKKGDDLGDAMDRAFGGGLGG